ncbi:MAG: carbonic anhydrase [Bdellovibrio bacteriovorus]
MPRRFIPRPSKALACALLGVLLALGGWGRSAYGQGPANTGAPAPWSYSGEQGPERWASLSPDYAQCAAGRLQSPIDIGSVERIPYSPLVFRYRSQSLDLVNDGYGVHLLVPPGSELRLRGDVYTLTEVHFHVPGEHRINGVGSSAEIHFIHRDARGRPVIVAVRVQAGRRFNSILARITDSLPMMPGEQVAQTRVGVNPLFLLPSERDYFTYTGSLGSPPCSEPVLWFVLAKPLEIDADLIRTIARATGANARPVQPLNGRPVYFAPRD